MRNLIFVTSLSALFVSTNVDAQHETKKYLKRNKKPVEIVYADSSKYARGFYVDSIKMLIGNSDGSIYLKKHDWDKAKLIFKLPNFTEVRDIEKIDNGFIAMQSGDDGKMVRLNNNGSMKVLSESDWKGRFFDGIDFIGPQGFLMGDPKDSIFTLYTSSDYGLTWQSVPTSVLAFKDEAGFAASGTNVQILNDSTFVFVTGGLRSRYIKTIDKGVTWSSVDLPYYPGKSTGGYSLCFANDSIGVIVGGDYADPDIHLNVSFYTDDGGESWINAEGTTRGYRSCVFYEKGIFYACGTNGIDFSFNNGIDWIPFADGTFFSLGTDGKHLFATSKYGRIYQYDLIESDDDRK